MKFDDPGKDLGSVKPRVVYVIDDDKDLRRSLHFLLATRQICVSPFASGTDFLSTLDVLKPAPIILDIRMPRIDGTQVLAELAERQNNWPVIVLTGHGEIGLAVQSLKAGAIDFLEKPVSEEILFHSIDAAFSLLAKQAYADEESNEAVRRLASLTSREAEVLDLLCRGRSNKQVAFDLSLSPRTVEMHRANAFRHLNVRTLIEAAAVRNQVPPDRDIAKD